LSFITISSHFFKFYL